MDKKRLARLFKTPLPYAVAAQAAFLLGGGAPSPTRAATAPPRQLGVSEAECASCRPQAGWVCDLNGIDWVDKCDTRDSGCGGNGGNGGNSE